MRRLENTLRGEASGHVAGVGVEGYRVEIVGEYFRFTKEHGGPVTGVDELDACIRSAGQVVGDYTYQHVSTLRLTPPLVSISACHVSWSGTPRNDEVLLWDSLERTSLPPYFTQLTGSSRQISSVHRQNRPRDEGGFVRGEEEDGVSHLGRFAEPPYRVCLPHRGYVLLGQFDDGLGRYGARRHGVDADAPCGPLDREVLGDP